ncbi:MAG: hypothetical protein KatS3mg023_0011 [Armatimonadota bacterium]|nr:MAG: hypothetical protein KatS3mg023_0011 [Armatimonadota bacterium]
MHRWLFALWLLVLPLSQVAGEVAVRRGDYEARLGANGIKVRYKGVLVVNGSRFTLFKPGYTGAYFSQADFTTLTTQVEGDRITVTGRIAEIDAQFTHQTVVDREGVQVWFTLRVRRQIEPSPVELALLMFPPEEFAGGSYRLDRLFGQARPQPLPIEKPQTSAPGTQLIAGGVRGLTLAGHRVEIALENLGEVAPSFYDMRSRDFPQPERVYWLLYQWTATGGETTCGVRLRARPVAQPVDRTSKAGKVSLVEGGRRMEVRHIFVHQQAHPVEKAAARELARLLREMSGRETPVTEGDGNGLPAQGVIYIGRSDSARAHALYDHAEFDSLGADGFILRLKGGNLLAAGGGYRGTVYAVYRLLERLGCRFYSTELEVIPRKATLEIRSPLNMVDKPAFEWRAMWGRIYPMTAGLSPGEWEAKVGDVDLPKMMGIPPRGFWHHTMGFLLPASSVPKEYLAEINGERRVTEPAVQQYCLSNPDLQKAMTEAVLRWIESTPDPVYYPVHYGDTGQFCQCERCKAWYTEHGSLTDAVIWFNNQIAQEVAKRFPVKFITTLAYWATRKPPVKERPLPNHLIIFCAIAECQARPWSHPVNLKRNVVSDLEQWIAIHPLGAQGIITFEYPTTYHYVGYPYPALYAFAENLKYYKRLGIRGVYICGLTDGHLVHLYSYVMPRLMWNPDADLRGLIDEFCKAWYGKAWQPMRDYVHRLHQSAFESSSEGVMDCHAGPGQRFFRELFTREWLDRQIYPLFDRAERLAENELIKRRIWREKWGVLFTDLFLNVQRSRDIVPDSSERGYTRQIPSREAYHRIAELLRLTRALGQSWTVEPRLRYTLSAIIGFEPTRTPWWECPQVQKLMQEPQRAYEDELRAFSDEEVAQRIVRLESPHLIADIVPLLGGRIWRLYSKELKEDLFWRGTLEWRLLQSGYRADYYSNFGGYEEYAGERFASPGWSERYECTVSPDRRSATLSTTLPNGLQLTRVVTLAPDEAAIEIESRLTNRSAQAVSDVVLRTHPQFRLSGNSEGLRLLVKQANGSWAEMPARSETFLSGSNLPAGAWALADRARGIAILNEFDLSQVRQCYLYTSAEFSNLELFSHAKTLAPGESLVLKHRYVVGR